MVVYYFGSSKREEKDRGEGREVWYNVVGVKVEVVDGINMDVDVDVDVGDGSSRCPCNSGR